VCEKNLFSPKCIEPSFTLKKHKCDVCIKTFSQGIHNCDTKHKCDEVFSQPIHLITRMIIQTGDKK
jgi:hypothetical protein